MSAETIAGPAEDTEAAVHDDGEPMTNPEYLKSLATHFPLRDWNYTRSTRIRHIRYVSDWDGYFRLDRRLSRALRSLFSPRQGHLFGGRGTVWDRFLYKIAFFRVQMRTDPHLPDGVLNHGAVITYWEETGEYLQMVQPSVGSLLADFLIAEPENPHAKKITAELDRIYAGYEARIRAERTDDDDE